MRLTWGAYNYQSWNGYGRYSLHMIRALLKAGIEVNPVLEGVFDMPYWLLAHTDTWLDGLTISCLPPYYLRSLPKRGPGIVSTRHWLLTMTEGSQLPPGWADIINDSDVERAIVPCEHNAEVFRSGGVECPISVIPGGTDPGEFPLRTVQHDSSMPYTFLALADRGTRKGWAEAYTAFFTAFGTVEETPDVRFVIKYRPKGNDLIDVILEKSDPAQRDPRIVYLQEDAQDIAQVYAQADCVCLPSRSEGWGMPHREAACMGIPVITQAYSGMDDGHTHEWAMVVEGGHMQRIPEHKHIAGEWRVCDTDELASMMRSCYDDPEAAAAFGQRAATWLRSNQTWQHSAQQLVQLLQQEGVFAREREYA